MSVAGDGTAFEGLPGRVGRAADERPISQQPPRDLRVHGVEPQVHAIGPGGQGDVAATIHQDAHLLVAGGRGLPCGGGKRVGEFEERGSGKLAIADLHPVDSPLNGARDPGRKVASQRGAADHEAKNWAQCRNQKVARPSSGLEAEA